MATTLKRRSLCMTKESERQLESLCLEYGETPSQVIVRALQNLHTLLCFKNITHDQYLFTKTNNNGTNK